MTMAVKSAAKEDKADGRNQRIARSRDKIKTAIVDLIRSGVYTPRAIDNPARKTLGRFFSD